MKRVYITTAVVCLALLLVFATVFSAWDGPPVESVLKVGFLYANDDLTPYTHNFALTEQELIRAYGDRVEVLALNNVPEQESEEPLRELARKGCGIIFIYSRTPQAVSLASEFPQTQFCQVSRSDAPQVQAPNNYHTFNAAVHEARYVAGIAAGMKLRQMLDRGMIRPEEALVGFVGANDGPEVLSAATAFLLGVRSVAPEATMRLRYTGAWCDYSREKACAMALIDEGCRIIAQHTATIGPSVACEETFNRKRVYHVGQDQSLIDIAPASTLVSVRVNWTPYVLGAVEAVLNRRPIERQVRGHVRGRDICAGFDREWVQVLELNQQNAVEGTREALDKAVEALRKGSLEVFTGPYTGVNPRDPSDTVDLSEGWRENAEGSAPGFHYLLENVMQAEA